MKLVNKFLTALAPVAMVGVITPTLVACNKGSSYTIHYGDDVNCLKKELGHYHSRNDIKNAIKGKIDQEPRGQVSLAEINSSLASKETGVQIQLLYYELIASKVWCEKSDVSIIGWDDKTTADQVQFNYCDAPKTINRQSAQPWFTYVFGEGEEINKVYIHVTGLINFPSYTYQLCTATN